MEIIVSREIIRSTSSLDKGIMHERMNEIYQQIDFIYMTVNYFGNNSNRLEIYEENECRNI